MRPKPKAKMRPRRTTPPMVASLLTEPVSERVSLRRSGLSSRSYSWIDWLAWTSRSTRVWRRPLGAHRPDPGALEVALEQLHVVGVGDQELHRGVERGPGPADAHEGPGRLHPVLVEDLPGGGAGTGQRLLVVGDVAQVGARLPLPVAAHQVALERAQLQGRQLRAQPQQIVGGLAEILLRQGAQAHQIELEELALHACRPCPGRSAPPGCRAAA